MNLSARPVRRRTVNPRIFGSVLHGTDREGSDIDILVDGSPGVTLFDLGGLQEDLQEHLGVPVQVVLPGELDALYRTVSWPRPSQLLIVIGESAVRIAEDSPTFVSEHADWPWREMRGMRNRGAHGYGSIVFEVVWDTLVEHVPPLLRRLEALGL